jgi:RNA polymerase sigma factor (sigma-70 family)
MISLVSRSSAAADPGREKREELILREQARAFARLAPEAEQALLARLPDAEAGEELVRHNLDLVAGQADAHAGQGVNFGDLYQEGSLGLIDAVKTYDGKTRFREFASLYIGLQMDAMIEGQAEARRADQQILDDAQTLDLAQIAFKARTRRQPTDAEMAEELGWSLQRIENMNAVLERARLANDESLVPFIDPAELEEIGLDVEPETNPYRQLPGAGPDD